jgi:uncharacterized protein (TIGR00299 family) protein
MSKILLLDPVGGLAGDMLLGALIDLGLSPDLLRLHLSSLGLPRFELEVGSVQRRQVKATRVLFHLQEEKKHRHLKEILNMLRGSSLPDPARRQAEKTFEILAEAEAAVHGVELEEVHFHEVGAADSILDIAGVCLGLHELDVERVFTSPLPGGSGTVQCQHGELPVPAPATMILLRGFPVLAGVGEGETVTPTGAALLRAWGEPLSYGLRIRPEGSGYGAGSRLPSLLRITLAEHDEELLTDSVHVFECNLDDATGEELGFLMELLFAAGALDVSYHPLVMKKSRPGVALTCLAPMDRRDQVRRTLLTHCTTLGVRERSQSRTILRREVLEVETAFGTLPIKVSEEQAEPEFEACARVARERNIPLRQVYQEVRRAYRER